MCIWRPREIPNVDYFELEKLDLEHVAAIGIEIWTMQDGILFDNILIASDENTAASLRDATWKPKLLVEKHNQTEEEQAANSDVLKGIQKSVFVIVEGSGGMIQSKDNHVDIRGRCDGDDVSIFKSSQVWIDHCSFASSYDGLIDIVAASTNSTISNCHFVKHDKALVFGASDETPSGQNNKSDTCLQPLWKRIDTEVTAVRFGFVHVVNNDYTKWQSYAIGGGDGATIISR